MLNAFNIWKFLTFFLEYPAPSSSSLDSRKSLISKFATKRVELDDGIAEDVRKIKESMKESPTPTPTTVTSTKKTRTPATTTKSTPKLKQSRQTRKDRNKSENNKIIDTEDDKASLLKKDEDIEGVGEDEKNDKPKVNTCELKNELLADWLDEEDVKEEVKPENNGEKNNDYFKFKI
jgi:hypothetical protein